MIDTPFDPQQFVKAMNELLVLATIGDAPVHGYQIALDVEERSDGMFTFQHGTLYPILHRLEAGGLIRGRWSNGPGRRRKVYSVTAAGRRAVVQREAESRDVFERFFAIVDGAAGSAERAG
jgi:DNA-binding PadR family transcriptional regulator